MRQHREFVNRDRQEQDSLGVGFLLRVAKDSAYILPGILDVNIYFCDCYLYPTLPDSFRQNYELVLLPGLGLDRLPPVLEALEFLQEAIPQADKKVLHHTFWMNGNSYPISERMLNAILPILGFFRKRIKKNWHF